MGIDGSGRHYDLKDYVGNNSGSGFITEAFSSRPEQTVGGATLGIARDLISQPDSQLEKLERAKENDTASQIAADTISIIPKFRALPAGLARATMLANPHKSLTENAAPFALNLGEGMALNHVGKMMTPGSGLQTALAKNIASPFAREIATHLSVGAGFGAVKGTFDTDNWVDENGDFAPGKLVSNVTKSTLAGAAINVPAGLVGVRVMKGSMSVMGETQVSQKVATTIAAAGSGYTSGAVFGGIDAVSHGKTFSETLSAMHFAGKVGMVTGVAIGATDRGSLADKYGSITETVLKANTLPVQEMTVGRKSALAEEAAPSRRIPESEQPRRHDNILREEQAIFKQSAEAGYLREILDYTPTRYLVKDVSPRLSESKPAVESVRRLKPDAKTKFDSFDDWFNATEPENVPMRSHRIEGHNVELLIEESFAKQMDAVRVERVRLEEVAQRDIAYDQLSHEQQIKATVEFQAPGADGEAVMRKYVPADVAKQNAEVIDARLQLRNGEVSKTVLPEDFIVMLDGLPNRGLVKRFVILGRQNPNDVWSKQKYSDPEFESAATALASDGTITFYFPEGRSQYRPSLRMYTDHEFSHLAAKATPEEARLHGLAAMVDRDIPNPAYRPRVATTDSAHPVGAGESQSVATAANQPGATTGEIPKTQKFYAREYAKTNHSEDGAVHLGEEMLAPDANKLIVLGDNAPVRTVLLGRSLSKVMAMAKPGQESTHASELRQRVRYIDEFVYPDAMKLLEQRLKHGSASEQAASAELLGHLGSTERHVPMLRRVATSGDSNIVPEGVTEITGQGYTGARGVANGGKAGLTFKPDQPQRTLADIAFDAMVKLNEGSPFAQLDFLSNEALSGSPTQAMAENRLRTATHESAPKYLQLAKFTGDGDKIPQLYDLMNTMNDGPGMIKVFNEIYRLGEGSPQFLTSLIRRGLELPELAPRVLELVKPQDAVLYENQLHNLMKTAPDKAVQGRARELLQKMPAAIDSTRAMELLRSETPGGIQEGLDIVIRARGVDNRLIEPLLEVTVNGTEAQARMARQALLRFSPQMIKFYSQELRRRGVVVDSQMLRLARSAH